MGTNSQMKLFLLIELGQPVGVFSSRAKAEDARYELSLKYTIIEAKNNFDILEFKLDDLNLLEINSEPFQLWKHLDKALKFLDAYDNEACDQVKNILKYGEEII